MTDTSRVSLCRIDDVEADCGLRCDVNGATYAVFKLDGEFFVIDDRCSHGPGSLSDGYVMDNEVECPFHQGRFDIRTGAPTEAPCTDPVRTWTAHLVDGRIEIDPDEAARQS